MGVLVPIFYGIAMVALGTVAAYVAGGLLFGFSTMFSSILTPIMNFLGFHDEDLYEVDIFASKIFTKSKQTKVIHNPDGTRTYTEEDDNSFENRNLLNSEHLLTRQLRQNHITYGTQGYDALGYCLEYQKVGDKQFGKYFRHGQWDFKDYLPETMVASNSIKADEVLKVIQQETCEHNVYIDDCFTLVPPDKDWCQYQLQQLYNYDVGLDYMEYNGSYYSMTVYEYDKPNNVYRVTLLGYGPYKKIRYTMTKHTLLKTNPATATSGATKDWRKETYTNTVIQADTGKYLCPIEDYKLSSTTTIRTEASVDLPQCEYNPGTIVAQYTGDDSEIEITVPAHIGEIYYIVRYRTDVSTKKLWMCPLKDATLPNPYKCYTDFEMYPIVCTRNGYKDITEMGDIERVNQSRALLNHIGVDLDTLIDGYRKNNDISNVQNAFVLFAVCPNNYEQVVSNALYNIFDYIYDQMPFIETEADSTYYSAGFKENPFNCGVNWRPRPEQYFDGKYGNLRIGEYAHQVNSLRVKIKQYDVIQGYLYHSVYGGGPSDYSIEYILTVYGGYKMTTYEYSDEPGVIHKVKGEEIEGFSCYCGSNNIPEEQYSDCCKKYNVHALPTATYSYAAGSLMFDENGELPYTAMLTNEKEETSWEIKCVKQIEKDRYRVLRAVDVASFHIIRTPEMNAARNVYPNEDKFIFPLPKGVVDRMTFMEKTALLGESAYIVFYAVQHQYLKWYQTGAFSQFLNIVGFCITVVVTVVSFGSMSWASMTATQVMVQVLSRLAIAAALQLSLMAINAFIDDPMLKAVLSVAAMAAAMIGSMYASNGFSFQGLDFNFGSAVEMGQIAIKAGEIYSGSIQQKQLEALLKKQENFASEYASRIEKMGVASDELSEMVATQFLANLSYGATAPGYLFKPEDFYTLVYTDWGVSMSRMDTFYDLTVGSFCENSLRLE